MFTPLPPSNDSPAGRVGCGFVLAGVLLFLGGGLVAVFIVDPSGKGDMWVMPLVGGAFFLVGALMLYASVRGARGLNVPLPQVFIESGAEMTPGAFARIQLRQPGPMKIESLKLKICCDRVYQRRVKENSPQTVEDHETLWETTLVEVRDQQLGAGETFERDAVLVLPADAPVTGPAQPDGVIRWQAQVWGEAGFMRATYRTFDLQVRPFGDARASAQPPATVTATPPAPPDIRADASDHKRSEPSGKKARPAGCAISLIMGLGFLLPAIFFLWAFFNRDEITHRGNPYMALVGGLLFGTIGLIALAIGVMSLFPSRREQRRLRRPRR